MPHENLLPIRLRELRQSFQMTQKELSNRLNVTPKVISFYELGQRKPPPEMLIHIANVFNVSIDYLLGTSDTPKQPAAPVDVRVSPTNPGGLAVPVLGDCAAGTPLYSEGIAEEYVEMTAQEARGYSADEFFALRAVGDSMYPYIFNGDIMIFHAAEDIEDGKVHALFYDGAWTVKYVRRNADGSIIIYGKNPEVFSPLTMPPAEQRDRRFMVRGILSAIHREV